MKWLWVLLLAPTIAFAGVGTIELDEGRTWNERKNKTENIDIGYDVLMDDFYQTGEDGNDPASFDTKETPEEEQARLDKEQVEKTAKDLLDKKFAEKVRKEMERQKQEDEEKDKEKDEENDEK